MLSHEAIHELHTHWFPHLTDGGLGRLIDMLEKHSPFLIRQEWSRLLAMGCLATHAAWHHPVTADLGDAAGYRWLREVVRIRPETSHVVREWDAEATQDSQTRAQLLALLRQEQRRRRGEEADDLRQEDEAGWECARRLPASRSCDPLSVAL